MEIILRNESASISIIATTGQDGFDDALRLVAAIRHGPVRPDVKTEKTQKGKQVQFEWRFDWHNTDDRSFAKDLVANVTVKIRGESSVTDLGRARLNSIQGQEWMKVMNWPVGRLPDVP